AMREIDGLIAPVEEDEVRNPALPLAWKPESGLAFDRVTVEIDGKKLLDDLTFDVRTGWIGIIGASGSGKSTLINVLAGQLEPAEGTIRSGSLTASSLK